MPPEHTPTPTVTSHPDAGVVLGEGLAAWTIEPEPLTAERAALMAAGALEQAADVSHDPEHSAALVQVADGWTRLHTALANAPKTIEQPEPVTVHIEGLDVKDVDPKQIADSVALAMGYTPKPAEIGVYRERAHLVAYLATQYSAIIAYNDSAEPDWPVIYIDTKFGQLSWHLAPDDLQLFPHVLIAGRHIPSHLAPEWDGHSTAEKYDRLALLVAAEAEGTI